MEKKLKFNLRNLPQSPRQRAKFQSICIYFRLKRGVVYIVYSFAQLLYCAFIIAHIQWFVKRFFLSFITTEIQNHRKIVLVADVAFMQVIDTVLNDELTERFN